ncbi:MAG TPA: twin-arginine translocation signal domain-containing protein, partial [Verrucomicrobiae bacterium]|nr:twin-arginine translocation signal domain-containing protein [Verrucomicrobiae bacterium]
MSAKKSDRRQFLRNGAALVGLAAGAAAARSTGAQPLPQPDGPSLQQDLAKAAADTYEGTPGPAPGQHFDAVYGLR